MTIDRADFPQAVLAGFDIFTRHPDDFVPDLADLEPGVVSATAKQQRAALGNPPFAPAAFVETVRRQGLAGMAGFLEQELDLRMAFAMKNEPPHRGKSDRPISHSSTARAHWRPSRMAQTTRD